MEPSPYANQPGWKEAAAQLHISYHTADVYIRDIYEKLQVNTRSSVVAKALKEGLL